MLPDDILAGFKEPRANPGHFIADNYCIRVKGGT